MKWLNAPLLLVCLLTGTDLLAHSDIKNPETRYRHHVMKAAAAHQAAIKELHQHNLPFHSQRAEHSRALVSFFKSLPDLFPRNGNYAESDASPKIWQEWKRFIDYAEKGEMAAEKLTKAVNPTQAQQHREQIRNSCKGCHKLYRD